MALVDTTWYCNFGNGTSTGYYAVTVRPQNTAVAAGVLRRQFTTPTVGNERVFVCIVAGTTANVTDATWVLTRGAKTTDGTATWQEVTGQAALNGDLTNTATWAQVKAATPAVLGQIIKRSNNASYQICTTAGAMSASEPAFSDTAGATTTDTTAVWTSLGAVSNFTGGQAPHARLANVFGTNWFASGNTVYVGDSHAETQSTTLTISGSSALMARILCHTASGPYPPTALTTGASITTTGTITLNITLQGSFYFYGLTFSGATTGNGLGAISMQPAAVGQVQNWYYFDSCSLRLGSVGTTNFIAFGGAATASWNTIILDNTTVRFAATTHYLEVRLTQLVWRNTGQVLAAGSSVPATLFQTNSASGQFGTIMLEALDLSQLTGSLYSNATVSSIGSLLIKDCKLNASTSVTTPINTGMTVQLAASASDATSYKSSRHTYEAVETTETSIVRTGGYQDPAGQAQSRKIVTTANAQWLRPYAAQPLAVWNDDVGSPKTVTVYGTVNSGSLPNNDDIWLEVSGLTNASFPVGSVVTSGKSNVWSAGSAGSSDSSTWGTPTVVTWDSSTATAVTVSGGGLVATSTGTTSVDQGVRSAAINDAGKFYFEITYTTLTGGLNCGVGVGTITSTYTNMGGSATTGAMLYRSGNIWANGANSGFALGNRAGGDVFGIAVDLNNRQIWFRVAPSGNWNGSGTANPATNTGGATLPAGGLVPFLTYGSSGGTSGNVFTANFGASAFTGTVPSGFTSGWTYNWSIFKLATTLTPQMPGYLIPQVKVAKASSTFYIDPLAVVT
jgi:hypothetical protein